MASGQQSCVTTSYFKTKLVMVKIIFIDLKTLYYYSLPFELFINVLSSIRLENQKCQTQKI